MWQNLKMAIIEPCRKHLKPEKQKRSKGLDEILMLMEERENLKIQTDGNIKKYRRTSNTDAAKLRRRS